MTIEEAIEALSLLRIFDAPSLSEAVKMAVAALHYQANTSPNDPLTLEQLRGIVEQLEWCGFQCEGGPLSGNKAFIRLKELAYRRRPEEVAPHD